MELRPGHRIDRYELVVPIADGGMGSVWLARMKRTPDFERFFALKTVLPHYAKDAGFRKMFLDETRIAAAISHANVASIIDVGEESGRLYMVMEWVDGDSLHMLTTTVETAGSHVPPSIGLRVVADACSGLHAVHEARDRSGTLLEIVHRDVSPHNILISTQGQAKLIDFGVARARDRLADTTSEGSLKGKVRYMSPEYAEGVKIDRRSDIWGIGAVLYRLIEGRSPIDAENNFAVLKLLLDRTAPTPMSDNVPAPLEAVIMKCLKVDPAERFATAEQVQRALERAIVETSLSATTADVAEYMTTQLGHLATRRRTTIEATLAHLEKAPFGLLDETPAPLSGRTGQPGQTPPSNAARTASTVDGAIVVTGLTAAAVTEATVLLADSPRGIRYRRMLGVRRAMQGVAAAGAVLAVAAYAMRYTARGDAPRQPSVQPAPPTVTPGPTVPVASDTAIPATEPAPQPAPTGTGSSVAAQVEVAPSASASSRKRAPSATTTAKGAAKPVSDVFDERR